MKKLILISWLITLLTGIITCNTVKIVDARKMLITSSEKVDNRYLVKVQGHKEKFLLPSPSPLKKGDTINIIFKK